MYEIVVMRSQSAPQHVRSAVLAVQRAAHLSAHHLAAAFNDLDLDLGPSEISCLANLSDGRTRTVAQLGAAVGTRPSTLTSVLDRLERRGLVTRSAHVDDRRSVVVVLTLPGRDAARQIMRVIRTLERRWARSGDVIAALDALPAELA